MGSLILNLLGQVSITIDAQELDLGYNKVRALLAYLVIEFRHSHSREKLAALLWPNSPQETARKNLRQALTTLRSAIHNEESNPPFLLVTRETIQFNPASDFQSDAGEFSRWISESAAHHHRELETCPACFDRLGQAVAVYKGDLLQYLSIPDSLEFEEWLLLTRERLRLQMIEVLGRLVAACERNQDDESALLFSRRRLTLDPWSEDAYRALMRVLARRGQRTAALAEYERCRRVLADELGIEPSSETLRLYNQIKEENNPPVQFSSSGINLSRQPHLLPGPLNSLIGREKETATLLGLVRRADVRLVSLLGAPGVGKTRLALHAASAAAADFENNVYFVSLTSCSSSNRVLPAILLAFGISSEGYHAPLERLCSALKDKPALLVLDPFEHVLDAATDVNEVLQTCPRLKILVTTRAPLNLRGEHRFLLGPLALPDPFYPPDPDLFMTSPAIAMFVENIQSFQPEFILTSKNCEVISAICRRLDGLPLAIEQAAAAIRLMSPQRLLERLGAKSGAALKILKAQARDVDSHHLTLLQAFQWSYDLLNPDAKRMFARLGVFSGGCTFEAIDAICNVGDIQSGSIDAVAILLDDCLLYQEQGLNGEYRFSLLNTLREFSVDRLISAGEWDALKQRHADYYLTFAKLAEPELSGRDQANWLDQVEQDLDNLRTALDWTLEASPDQALQLAAALFPFWHVRSLLAEGRLYLEKALAANPLETPLRGRVLAAAGLLAQRQGDYERAEALTQESVDYWRGQDDRLGLAYALNNLAIVRMSTGDNRSALETAEESLALCLEADFGMGVGRAQMLIGQIALNEDRLAAARQYLGTSLAFWLENGDRKNAVLCQINLGRIEIASGNYAEAVSNLEESLKLSRQVKDRQWELVALWNLADIQLRLGNYEESAPLLAVCLEQSLRLGDRFFEAISHDRLGLVALRRADYDEGLRRFHVSLEIGRRIGSNWIVADALLNLGYAGMLTGEYSPAQANLEESLRLFHTQRERSDLVFNLEHLAQVHLLQGRLEPAVRLLGVARTWREANGAPLPPDFRPEQEVALAYLQSQLEWGLFSLAWAAGQEMDLDQAVEYALNIGS